MAESSSEFALIERFFLRHTVRADVVKGVGDDAAVLRMPADQDLVATVDTLVEGTHFPHGTAPFDIGHKALAVNLSDLAAMGAEPRWTTLALTLPQVDEAWLAQFSKGFRQLADRCNVALVGGDLTRGPLSVSVQALGVIPKGVAIGRDEARPGDLIFVTGRIGDAGLALAHVLTGRHLDERDREPLLARLHRPEPRVEAGLLLRGFAHAAIDISDGLIADLRHILHAGGLGARLELERLPRSEALRRHFDEPADWRLPLAAGDDYELLFTAAEFDSPVLGERFQALGLEVTVIGRIEGEAGLRLVLRGAPFEADCAGYDHFDSNSSSPPSA